MSQPSSKSNLVSFFCAKLTKLSHKCKNVTRKPSAKNLLDVPADSLSETLPDIPPDFSQTGSQMTSSDYLYDEDTRTELEKFFNLCPEDDHITIKQYCNKCFLGRL